MISLGIETATTVCGVALLRDGHAAAVKIIDKANVHSEQLVPMIGEVLELSGLRPRDLECIAISIGPGSFTGLRIGLSVAKGLSLSSDIPLIAVPTLEALAFNAVLEKKAGAGSDIIPLIDAHRGEAFGAIFRRTGDSGLEEIRQSAIAAYEEIETWAGGMPTALLVGSELQHVFPPGLQKRFWHSPCNPVSVATIGAEKFGRGGRADRTMLEPMYLREFIPRNGSGAYHTNKGA